MKRTAMVGLGLVASLLVLAGCGPSAQDLVKVGITQYQTGRSDQAKLSFQRALNIAPSDPDANFYMGRIHHSEKFYEQAIFRYQNCIDAQPSYPDAMRFLRAAQQECDPAGRNLMIVPDPTKQTPP